MGWYLHGDDLLLDEAEYISIKADVVFEDVETALQQDLGLQGAHEVVHHVLHASRLQVLVMNTV